MNPNLETEDLTHAVLSKPILTGRLAVVRGLVFLAEWVVPGVVVPCGQIEAKDTGSFGDTFGVINALSHGAAFAGLNV